MHIGKVVCIQCSDCPLPWAIDSEKIWLKQPKAASALDFSYFQHASKLVTHHKEPQPKGCGSFFLVHDLGTFDAEKLHLRFRRIRFTPKFTPIKSFTP